MCSTRNKSLLFILIFVLFITYSTYSQYKPTNFGQNESVMAQSFTTWILEDFDNHELATNVNNYNGGKHDINWSVRGGVYITHTDAKPYPQTGYVKGYPRILNKEYLKEEESMQIYGIRAAFNRRGVVNTLELIIDGDNKNDVFLDLEGKPLPGVFFTDPVYEIGIYALGILRDYRVSAEFETESGIVFSVPLGSLNYKGWKALTAQIPIDKFVNEGTFISNTYLVRLLKLTIKTMPNEIVSDFVIYFDQMFYTVALVDNRYYDGYEYLKSSTIKTIDWKSETVPEQQNTNTNN